MKNANVKAGSFLILPLFFLSASTLSYPFMDEYVQIWPFLPFNAVKDAGTIAALERISGEKIENIFDLTDTENYPQVSTGAGDLCQGVSSEDILVSVTRWKCSLIKITNVENGEWNPLFRKYNIENCDKEKECSVFRISTVIFNDSIILSEIQKALMAPCNYLINPIEKNRKEKVKAEYPFLSSSTDYSWRVLDCRKKNKETFNTIIDKDNRSILVVRKTK